MQQAAEESDSESRAAAVAVDAARSSGGDERLAYRGVFQRLFIRPEIGAVLGAIGIWIFFWAVSIPFGTANGWSNIIDNASTLGIMAVAVSMLMVGGEFDLSSGAMTGAMGILVILLSKEVGEFGGAGLHLAIAIPLSFIIALAIGFANGWMVEKTLLPSFIVTLATFFVLRGLKLGLSKLIVDQIQVGDIRDADGYEIFRPIFAAEWDRTTHQFEARDLIYTICLIAGSALIVLAVYEMHFAHRQDGKRSTGIPQFVIGLVVAASGVVALHAVDDAAGNWIGGALIAVGTLVGLIGLGRWRFEPEDDRGTLSLTNEVLKPVGIGLACLLVALISSLVFDSDDTSDLFFPFTVQGFRGTLILIFGLLGFTFLFVAASRARRVNPMTKFAISTGIAVIIAIAAFVVRAQSEAYKFRVEAFSVLLLIALLQFTWALMGLMFEERTRTNARSEHLGGRMIAAGAVLIVVGFGVKLLFTTEEEILGGISPAKFSMRNVWFILFTAVLVWVLGRTRFGSWTFAVGGNKEASRQVGVPAARTKTQLFMLVSGAAWLVGMLLAFRLNTIQANTGNGLEFNYIIAAVVGGTLLTGGYGTALGGAIGALIISMGTLGIPFARWNSDWQFLFLGVILLIAVIANRTIRTRAESLRR